MINIYIYTYGNFGSILGYVRLSGEWKEYSRRLKNIELGSKKYHRVDATCILY